MGFFNKLSDIINTSQKTKTGIKKNKTYDETMDILYKGSIGYKTDIMDKSIEDAEKHLKEGYDIKDTQPNNDSDASPDSDDTSSVTSPQIFMNMFERSHQQATDILFKKDNETGEDEIKSAQKFAYFDTKDEQLKNRLQQRISSWYDNMYGTAPLKRDAAGRQIEPEIKLTVSPAGNTTKEVFKGLKQLSQHIYNVENDDSPEKGISALQKTLNNLGTDPQLKIDNILGPKTDLATRTYLAQNGYNKFANAFKSKIYNHS